MSGTEALITPATEHVAHAAHAPRTLPFQGHGSCLPFSGQGSAPHHDEAIPRRKLFFRKHLLKHAEAREFWTKNFNESQSVKWTAFSLALSLEFALTNADVAAIHMVLDTNADGTIDLVEFDSFTAKDGLALALMKKMNAPTLPPKRTNTTEIEAWIPILYDHEPPKARISTWQPGRDQQAELAKRAEVKIFSFVMALFFFVRYILTFDGAKLGLEWVENCRVCYGAISVIDFCSATVTIFNYRNEAERLTKAGDARYILYLSVHLYSLFIFVIYVYSCRLALYLLSIFIFISVFNVL